jgi:hypothetical protein
LQGRWSIAEPTDFFQTVLVGVNNFQKIRSGDDRIIDEIQDGGLAPGTIKRADGFSSLSLIEN